MKGLDCFVNKYSVYQQTLIKLISSRLEVPIVKAYMLYTYPCVSLIHYSAFIVALHRQGSLNKPTCILSR